VHLKASPPRAAPVRRKARNLRGMRSGEAHRPSIAVLREHCHIMRLAW